MKKKIFLAFFLMHINAFASTYNGPENKKYYREPKDLICNGMPDYPKGANLSFSKGVVGNLLDGFVYAYTDGQVGILYFQNMTSVNPDKLSGLVTRIDVLDKFRIVYKELPTQCVVKRWHP